MGNVYSESSQQPPKTQRTNYFILKITNQQLQSLRIMIRERQTLKHPHLCIANSVQPVSEQASGRFCETLTSVKILFEPFDDILIDRRQSFPLPYYEVEKIICAVCSALQFLYQRKSRHGDISTKKICRIQQRWKLIDNYFIRGGITAYQKILEGDDGFISPSQMQRIRHGFVRESPPIEESDQIFALGMTCLQLMTGRSSMLCYKESHKRFNDQNFEVAISIIQDRQRHPEQLSRLVCAMLNFNENRRATIKQILQYPIIAQHASNTSRYFKS